MNSYTVESYIKEYYKDIIKSHKLSDLHYTLLYPDLKQNIGWKIYLSSHYNQSGYLLKIIDKIKIHIQFCYKFIISHNSYKINKNKVVIIYPENNDDAVEIVDKLQQLINNDFIDVCVKDAFKISNNIYTKYGRFDDENEFVGIPNYTKVYSCSFNYLYFQNIELPKNISEINDFLKIIYKNSYEDILFYTKLKIIKYLAWHEFNEYAKTLNYNVESKFELDPKFKPFEITDLKFDNDVIENMPIKFWNDDKIIINKSDKEQLKLLLLNFDV